MKPLYVRIVRQAKTNISHITTRSIRRRRPAAIARRHGRSAHSRATEARRAGESIEVEVRDIEVAGIGFEGEVFVPFILGSGCQYVRLGTNVLEKSREERLTQSMSSISRSVSV